MNRFGTGLSLGLYWLMLVIALLLLLAGLVGVLLIGLGIFNPAAFADLNASVNGVPVGPSAAPAVGTLILAGAAVGSTVVWQLIGLLRSAADGEPFVGANVRRLRIAAAALAAAAFVGPLARVLLPTGAGGSDFSFDGGSLLGALLALVLAEVFHAGVALRDEVEGTI